MRDASTDNNSSKINFKLYNLTDNTAFDNSLVYTNSTAKTLLQSGNIVHDFPDKEISLGLQLFTDIDDVNGSALNFYLFLYRK